MATRRGTQCERCGASSVVKQEPALCLGCWQELKAAASRRLGGASWQARSRGLRSAGAPDMIQAERWLELQGGTCVTCAAAIDPYEAIRASWTGEVSHRVRAQCSRSATCLSCGYAPSDRREVPRGQCSPCRAAERALEAHPRVDDFLERRSGRG